MTHIGRLIVNIICKSGRAESARTLVFSYLHKRPKLGLKRYGKLLLGLLLIGMFGLTGEAPQTSASALSQAELPSGLGILPERRIALDDPDADCLMCHADPDFKGTFQNGDTLPLYVDWGEYAQSVHEPAGLNCVACHTDVSQYPHHTEEQITCVACHGDEGGQPDTPYTTLRVQLSFADRREMTLTINESCRSCHEQEFEISVDSAHIKVLEGGNRDAPVCVDCHGSHLITSPEEPRAKISRICGTCHGAVYSTYHSSIHGAALNDESNPDVPTCVDCHGVHGVRGPRDSLFRNDSISICGDCHGDQALMEKYDISADVFQTYLDDFHGRTVDLFRRQSAGVQSNKAVCFDCHGIHNIRRSEDPLSTIYPENLQNTCQQCHADAGIKFPDAWLSHYVPTWEDTPALLVVNSIYYVLIPLTIGSFLIYIGLDASKRWLERRQVIRQAIAEAEREDYDFGNVI